MRAAAYALIPLPQGPSGVAGTRPSSTAANPRRGDFV
jgi:hypothetical protein